uniref:endo-polygalacturonase n=1 Tax=Phaedon cochleariae TaxID=80249 RepID=K7DWA4_PHACE|nr:glycoside hydrolase family 28 protein [Phaedon cochleariae]
MFSVKLAFAVIAAVYAAASAFPANETLEVGASCTITSFGQVSSVLNSCSNIVISGLSVPGGKTLELKLKSGSTVTFQGKTVFGVAHWDGPLLEIIGSKVTVKGASGHVLDGQGPKYWDGKGDGGVKKPKFVKVRATGGSVLTGLHVLNCPRQCVSVNSCDHVTIDGWNVDVSAGDKNKLGHNTDGFDISSTSNVVISNTVVKNQDDCVAVNKAQHVTISKLQCSGGHGLSLSVGMSKTSKADNTVSDVHFSDCTVSNSDNGIHIKTHSDGGPGVIDNVSYKNIKLSGIAKYGVNIEQDYEKGHPTGTPKANIPITGLSITGVSGSMTGKNSKAVYILCAKGGCSNWSWGVNISGAHKQSNCTMQPSNVKC